MDRSASVRHQWSRHLSSLCLLRGIGLIFVPGAKVFGKPGLVKPAPKKVCRAFLNFALKRRTQIVSIVSLLAASINHPRNGAMQALRTILVFESEKEKYALFK